MTDTQNSTYGPALEFSPERIEGTEAAVVKQERKHKPRSKGTRPAKHKAAKSKTATKRSHQPRKAASKKANKRPLIKRVCIAKGCARKGKAFLTRDKRQHFCSRTCGNRQRQKAFYNTRKKAFAIFLKSQRAAAKGKTKAKAKG